MQAQRDRFGDGGDFEGVGALGFCRRQSIYGMDCQRDRSDTDKSSVYCHSGPARIRCLLDRSEVVGTQTQLIDMPVRRPLNCP